MIVAHDDAGEAQRFAEIIGIAGGVTRAAVCDATEEASIIGLFADADRADEVPDVVVIGAMMQGGVPVVDMSTAQWDSMYAVNAPGAFITAREAIRLWKKKGRPGRIIALSTIGSEHPVLVGNAAYGSSKAALNQLCRNLAF